jgi:recombination protein RecA
VDLGVELNVLKKAGSWFSYGDTKIGQGREAVKQTLADNPELCEEIEAKIRAAFSAKADE